MEHYDFVFAGGGLAGLSLACQMVRSPLRDRSILIIDTDLRTRNDRTWAFWSDRPLPFDDAVYRSWDRLRVVGENCEAFIDLKDYRYSVIRGEDFHRCVREELAAHDNVSFRRGAVQQIRDGVDQACVTVDGQTVSGRWVFDSVFQHSGLEPDLERYHYLKLHFRGWEIETPVQAFDPQVPTLLDFRTPQQGETRFFYVLPFSRHRALVEYTVFSARLSGRNAYHSALRAYLEETLGIEHYRVLRKEGGCIPITDQPFRRQTGHRIMTIGTKGGRVKPSTGYAFVRVQEDSAAIVRSLHKNGHPFEVPLDAKRYRLYDSMLLDIMGRRGDRIKDIFALMFKNNPTERVFRFLDEEASLWKNVQLFATLPPRIFLERLAQKRVWGALGNSPLPIGSTRRGYMATVPLALDRQT